MSGLACPEVASRAAQEIRNAVKSLHPPHRLILGSDAYRRMGEKLRMFQAEFDSNEEVASATDYPDAGKAVL